MTRLSAYLHFGGNCREAMEFYRKSLGGSLKIQKVGDTPLAAQMPGKENLVMHSMLESEGMVILASDWMETGGLVRGNAMSLCVNGGSIEEMTALFSRLSEGGKVSFPLKEEFFGTFGALTDKFGVDWMFQAEPKRK